MTVPLATTHPTPPMLDDTRSVRTRRWIAIGLVSVLAHLVFIDALPRFTRDPGGTEEEPLRARLMPLPAAVPDTVPQPPAPAPRVEPVSKSTSRPRLKPMDEVEFVPESLTNDVAQVTTAAPTVGAMPRAAPAPSAPAPPIAQTTPPPPTVAPQSVRLAYKVVYVERKYDNPITYEGRGAIDWSVADGRYRVDLQAWVTILFKRFNALASHSEGAVAGAGLAPDRYTEKPGTKSLVATNFNRDARQTISFSASTASFPLQANVQDRLSVIFQLGALLRGDPSLGAAGRIEIPVAGVRDVETWTFDALGTSPVEIDHDARPAVHLRRVPKPDSNDRIVDVWVTQAEGVPARVLYTERDGSTYELTLDRVEALSRPDDVVKPPAPG